MDIAAPTRAVLRRILLRYPYLGKRVVQRLFRISSKLSNLADRLDRRLGTRAGASVERPAPNGEMPKHGQEKKQARSGAHIQAVVRTQALAEQSRAHKQALAEQSRTHKQALGEQTRKGKQDHAEAQIRRQKLAAFTIGQVPNPANWLAQAEALEVFEPTTLIRAIDAILRARDSSISRLFESVSGLHPASGAELYAYLKKTEWISAEVSTSDLDQIACFIKETGYDDAVRKHLMDAFFSIVISCGSAEQLNRMLGENTPAQWQHLSFNRRLQVVRKLAANGNFSEAEKRLQDMKRTATPIEAVKMRNFEFLAGWLREEWCHQEAEEMFVDVVSPGVARDFHAFLAPVYAALRPRMRYMEVRTNAEERAALLGRVTSALSTRTAFSCLRLSDREGYLFTEQGHFSPSDVANCEMHWWGTELSSKLRSQIVAEARAAIEPADVVGIPAIHRFIRDVSAATQSLTSSLQMRGLVDVLLGVRDVAAPDACFSEDKVNVGLFGDVETVATLASKAHRLIIVTSLRVDHLPASLRAHGDLRHIALPTHCKTRLNEKYVQTSEVLPHVYSRLIEELENVAEPGTLVLVAGGLIGKIFVGHARAKGAVALDMGHTVDDWTNGRLSALR